ncbi:MAG: single-stranded DNA-binding protein [Planctomycetes bacterium]|nr:single-stranded DNA-binding protein [Planctomycetota bacterium]
MANINRVFLAGNLTRDPQVRFLANEKAVAEFGLAINRRFKAGDGSLKEETTFVDIEVWGRTAELCSQYLTKGRGCFVEGRLKLDTWEDKKDGSKRSKLRVVADNVQFLDGGKGRSEGAPADAGDAGEGGDAAPAPARPSRPASPPPAAADDEPPF